MTHSFPTRRSSDLEFDPEPCRDPRARPAQEFLMDDYSAWVGRSETREDVATAAPLAGLAALLDHDVSPWTAGTVPPLGHRSEEHTSELQSLMRISYAVFCLKKKKMYAAIRE